MDLSNPDAEWQVIIRAPSSPLQAQAGFAFPSAYRNVSLVDNVVQEKRAGELGCSSGMNACFCPGLNGWEEFSPL